VALAKAREIRDVIAQLGVAHASKFASLGSEKEEETPKETCRLAFEAATNAALELRGEADGHRAGNQTRVVQIARRGKLPQTKKLPRARGERAGLGAGMLRSPLRGRRLG
jgi:hypothetical protein